MKTDLPFARAHSAGCKLQVSQTLDSAGQRAVVTATGDSTFGAGRVQKLVQHPAQLFQHACASATRSRRLSAH